MYDTDIDPFDFGEGNESAPIVSDTDTKAEAPEVEVSSADSTKETASTNSTGAEKDVAEAEGEGEKVSDESTKDEKTEKTTEELLADVDKEIANEKNATYYRHSLKSIRQAFSGQTERVMQKYQPLEAFGEVAKVVSDLELLKGLEAIEVNPVTNQPEKTARPFVAELIKTRGMETAASVMHELAYQPSPYTEGLNLIQEVVKNFGLDPARINDFKKFAENGYQLVNNAINQVDPDELSLIPENLREAYLALTPDDRLEFQPWDGEGEDAKARRERFLAPLQFKLDVEREKESSKAANEQREQKERQEAIQKFNNDWANETAVIQVESGHRLTNSFVDTLVKDANLTEREAWANTLIINSAIRGSGTEKEKSLELLKKDGIELNSDLPGLFEKWEKATETAANCKLRGQETEYKSLQNEIDALEKSIASKANPIVAYFAEKTAETMKARTDKKNALLTDSQKFNKGIKPNEGKSDPITTGSKPLTETERQWVLDHPFG